MGKLIGEKDIDWYRDRPGYRVHLAKGSRYFETVGGYIPKAFENADGSLGIF